MNTGSRPTAVPGYDNNEWVIHDRGSDELAEEFDEALELSYAGRHQESMRRLVEVLISRSRMGRRDARRNTGRRSARPRGLRSGRCPKGSTGARAGSSMASWTTDPLSGPAMACRC